MLRTTGLLLLFAGLALGETQSGTVTSGGQPIPGATVVATCGDDGKDKITTVTDDAGRFELGGLPSTPCRFSVAMFGFDAPPREVTASASPLTFDLSLQHRASLPAEPNAPPAAAPDRAGGGGRQGFRRRQPGSPESSNTPPGNTSPGTTPQAANGNGPGRGGFGGSGRAGFGRGGAAGAQGGQAANGQQQGFQNLSLLQNGENQIDSEVAPGTGPADDAGANLGLGGPAAFGGPGGFGGPGNAGNPFAGQNGATTQEAGAPGFGGPGGGPGGGGAPGGGGGFGGGG